MNLCIVIPAHNEEKRIGRTLKAFTEYYASIKGVKTTLLVVINNTQDNTKEVVRNFIKRGKVKVKMLVLEKGGKGYAVIEGFKEALTYNYDLIGFVDADLATSPDSFDVLRKNIYNREGAIASRYLPQSQCHPPLTIRRAIIGKAFNLFARLLLHLPQTDTQCGAKLFTKKATKLIVQKVKMTQWAFDIELLYECKAQGLKIKELPTTWVDIEGSKVRLIKTSLQMFFAVLQLRIKKSPYARTLEPFSKSIVYLWRKIQ
jgi:glycosyltransferase involved in cell wall biosynthesis